MLIVGSTQQRTRPYNSKFAVCQISSAALFQRAVYRMKLLSALQCFAISSPRGMHSITKHSPFLEAISCGR